MNRISVPCQLIFASAVIFCLFVPGLSFSQKTESGAGLRFLVSFSKEKNATPLDGRVLLMLSTNNAEEPRFQITNDPDTQLIFGVDVDALKPGDSATIDRSVLGFPAKSLADVPAGWYWVQALLQKYETFHLKNGHTVNLPMDQGEGRQWNRAPGNLYSLPSKIWFDPSSNPNTTISLDQVIPPLEPVKDSKYVKHFKIQSKRLTEFWGRPMYLGASVLLPDGFDEHPEARYPLAIFHSHFAPTISGFRDTPPDPNLKPDYSKPLQDSRLQPDRAGTCLSALQGLDGTEVPATGSSRDPARQSVLRRFLRGQLGQSRPLRRCDYL